MKILARNDIVTSELNVNFNVYKETANDYDALRDHFVNLVQTDYLEQTHTYDVVAHFAYVAPQSTIRECNANLLDKDTFPYFDFDLACWNQSIVQNAKINDKLYFVAGNMNLSTFNNAIVMWHNMSLYDSIKANIPNAPDGLQDLAVKGEWTYSMLYNLANYYANDSADSECGDTYGLFLAGGKRGKPVPIDAIPYAWDLELITTDPQTGAHKYNIIGNTKLQDAINKYKALFEYKGNAYTALYPDYTNAICGHNHFVEGDILFLAEKIYQSKAINLAMRGMKDDFALLPLPKLENTQGAYCTTAADSYTLMIAIDHSKAPVPTKGKAVSAFLQYSTEKSYEDVYLYYLKEIVEPTWFGVASDEEDQKRIDKSIAILNELLINLKFNFWTIYSPLIGDAVHLFRDACAEGKQIDAVYRETQDIFDKAIKDNDIWLGLVS